MKLGRIPRRSEKMFTKYTAAAGSALSALTCDVLAALSHDATAPWWGDPCPCLRIPALPPVFPRRRRRSASLLHFAAAHWTFMVKCQSTRVMALDAVGPPVRLSAGIADLAKL